VDPDVSTIFKCDFHPELFWKRCISWYS
jgi:hypothetical protein